MVFMLICLFLEHIQNIFVSIKHNSRTTLKALLEILAKIFAKIYLQGPRSRESLQCARHLYRSGLPLDFLGEPYRKVEITLRLPYA